MAIPYLPVEAQKLMQDINDWRNTQEIVRLTFKALSDVVKEQGLKIYELEQHTSKISELEEQCLRSTSSDDRFARIYKDMNALKDEVLNIASSAKSTKEVVIKEVEKTGLDSVRSQLKTLEHNILNELDAESQNVQFEIAKHKETISSLQRDTHDILQRITLIENKTEKYDQRINGLKDMVLKSSDSSKTDVQTYVSQHVASHLNGIWEELNNKPSFQDLMKTKSEKDINSDLKRLIDAKVGFNDLTLALSKVKERLQFKVERDSFEEFRNNQIKINELMCSECCIGRWLWKTGNLLNGFVPWEIESINAFSENFAWNKSPLLSTLAPGLYHLVCGFYAHNPSNATVLLNDETLIHKEHSGKWSPHSTGNVRGLIISEYISLPPRASISVKYSGTQGEGFISLRKL